MRLLATKQDQIAGVFDLSQEAKNKVENSLAQTVEMTASADHQSPANKPDLTTVPDKQIFVVDEDKRGEDADQGNDDYEEDSEDQFQMMNRTVRSNTMSGSIVGNKGQQLTDPLLQNNPE